MADDLVVKNIVIAGLDPTAVAYVAADVGGDQFPNDGMTFLHFKNGPDQETTITVNSVKACSQGYDHNSVVVLPVSKDRMIGPFDRGRFNTAAGKVDITYAGGVTNVAVAAINLVPA